MKKRLLMLLMLMMVVSPAVFGKQPDSPAAGFVAGVSRWALSQTQSQPSSAQRDGVKVYSSQGYYVKSKNFNNGARYYSFTYIVTGYNDRGDVVSKTEETMKNLLLQANEERTLFTAPADPKKETTYWITITDVSGVRDPGASDRRR